MENSQSLALRNIVSTLQEVSHRLSMPLDLLKKMVKNGMPVNSDGKYDIDDIKAWRELKLLDKDDDKNFLEGNIKVREVYELDKTDHLLDVEVGLISKAKILLKSLKRADIDGMDTEKKFKAIKDTVSSFETIHRAERLEKGESTQNVAVIVQAIRESKKRMLRQEKVVEGVVVGESV